jgi:gliding motility-associated-like protein
MSIKFFHLSFLLMVLTVFRITGQVDDQRPESPVLDLVNVDGPTGNVEISWSPSPSPDVAGYVIYLYKNNLGYELDTIYDPAVRSYLRTGSGSGYYSESFVVTAIDSAGNISPLSNPLSTIYSTASIDTCNKLIEVKWNSYTSIPKQVTNYSLLYSVNGGSFTEIEQAAPGKTSILLNDFTVDAQYCFIIRANLAGGYTSGSNKTCLQTKMQRAPDWINADYATVVPGNEILLSFKIDPLNEIRTFDLERKTGSSGDFEKIWQFTNNSGTLLYNDANADISKVNYYKLKAINNCNIPATISNIASNIVLALNINEDEIKLSWNHYRTWNGTISSYKLYVSTGGILEERNSVSSGDTVFTFSYSDLMYEVSAGEVCFLIKAVEASNPYGVNGESRSSVICTPVIEKITVPNIFTPDNNSVNDFFRPVLSFTPLSYKLIINDLKRKIVFETIDFTKEWDGTMNGSPLADGVYLWFLKVRTPSGKDIIRSGTITIMHNR